jgi:hypothetical protein
MHPRRRQHEDLMRRLDAATAKLDEAIAGARAVRAEQQVHVPRSERKTIETAAITMAQLTQGTR